MHQRWSASALLAFAVAVLTQSSCGGASSGGVGGGDGGYGGQAHCSAVAAHCAGDSDCCSGQCDPSTSACLGGAPVNCLATGASCTTSVDCCTLSCVNGACSPGACTSDGQACTTNGQCCGGTCSGGLCKALSTTCKTSGNACTQNGECCSQLCAAGRCSITSSFCTQNGDVCSQGPDCCGGVCTIAAGQTLGTCGAPPAGATFCNGGTDGTVCSGCGDCCSRLCAPYGPYGVKVCQPAEGCHIDGDLCTKTADCCGAAGTGLPGAGNVVCEIPAGLQCGHLPQPHGLQPRGGRLPLHELRVLHLVGAQRLLRGAGQLRRVPARQAGRSPVPRDRRVRGGGCELRVRRGLLRRWPLRPRSRRAARVPDRVQRVVGRVHGRRRLLQRPALLRGGRVDERNVRRGAAPSCRVRGRAAAELRLLRSSVHPEQRLLQRGHLRRTERHLVRRRAGLHLCQSDPVTSRCGNC